MRLFASSLQALAYASLVAADSLPYNPTHLLTAANSSLIYLLKASSQSSYQGVLQAIDVSRPFTTGQLALKTLSDTLPFLSDSTPVPYTPTIDASGNITVVAGNCTAGVKRTGVWRYWPGSGDTKGRGEWMQALTSVLPPAPGSYLTGSNYLARAVAFSARVSSSPSDLHFYLFGGMCPFTSSNNSDWVRDATYSNAMLDLSIDTSKISTTFDLGAATNEGSAIAEAGFSMTGLVPTYSVNGQGQPQSRQQNFMLIGGHTKGAFINMSNVAMFSLPEESWTYVPVAQPSSSRTDLTIRQANTIVEPRSGHTAVLSDDGTSVVVFGGWVGDVSNPAEPQLAVLHLGTEYGGDPSVAWTWTVPAPSVDLTPAGQGIYGHGATMLPGGVMMVVGGYTISGSSGKRSTQASNSGVYLYNTTSNAWIDSYSPPKQATSAQSSSGPLSRTSERVGLGVGLGVGLAALTGLIGFAFWYFRRQKQRREEPEQERLGSDNQSEMSFAQIDQPFLDRGGIDGRGGHAFADHQSSSVMPHAGSTGLFVDIPSPTRGLRKGLAARPYQYHPAPRYDDGRINRGSSNIPPILESADEESLRGDKDQTHELTAVQKLYQVERALEKYPQEQDPERNLQELQRILKASDSTSTPVKDPFADPEPNPLGSHPVTPEVLTTMRQVPTGAGRAYSPVRRPLSTEMDGSMNWMIINQTDNPPYPSSSSTGRSSPSRTDERTPSTLSERSQRSQASRNSITPRMSTRTDALLSRSLAISTEGQENEGLLGSPTGERTSTMGTMSSLGGRQSPQYFNSSQRPTSSNARQRQRDSFYAPPKSADSFSTAKTSFAQLQDEGAALLGGRPMADPDGPYQRALAATNPEMHRLSGPPSAPSIVAQRRRPGWVGSLRRALTAMSNEHTFSFTSSVADALEPSELQSRTAASSPTRPRKQPPRDSRTSAPRRAVSDGGALLRQKRGQDDWEKNKEFSPYHDDPDPGDWGEPQRRRRRRGMSADSRGRGHGEYDDDDDDADDTSSVGREWDVETAAAQRDVQVLFTVPKARLRVVNADVASSRSVSDPAAAALSRSGSALSAASSSASSPSHRRRRDAALVPATRTTQQHGSQESCEAHSHHHHQQQQLR